MNSPSDKLAKLEAQRAALDLKIRAEVRQERERRRRYFRLLRNRTKRRSGHSSRTLLD